MFRKRIEVSNTVILPIFCDEHWVCAIYVKRNEQNTVYFLDSLNTKRSWLDGLGLEKLAYFIWPKESFVVKY